MTQPTDITSRLEAIVAMAAPGPWLKSVDAHSHSGRGEDGPCYAISVVADPARSDLIYIDDANTSLAALSPCWREVLVLVRAASEYSDSPNATTHRIMNAALDGLLASLGEALGGGER